MAPSRSNHIVVGSRVSELEFRMLGPLEVRANGVSLDLGGDWARWLLARLLLDANRAVPFERLSEDLLGVSPSPSATRMLGFASSQLRKALGEDVIASGPDGYELRVDWTRTDVHRFEQIAAVGRERLTAGSPIEAAEVLRLALGLWRGEPLGDFGGEAWARPEVARLEELRLGTIEDQIDAGLAGGGAGVLAMVSQLVVHYPRRGRLRAQLIRALFVDGREDEANDALEDARRFFTDELAMEDLIAYLPLPVTLSAGVSALPEPIALADATSRLFDDWAFRLGRGEWPDSRDYLELAGDNEDGLRLLMDTYVRALPRPAPAPEDLERAQAWLAAARAT
jgi:DNA-binding SARP family transcriptional activator